MVNVVVLLALVYAISYFTAAFTLRARARRDDAVSAPAGPMLSPATLPEE
jgi:hypothetical protein